MARTIGSRNENIQVKDTHVTILRATNALDAYRQLIQLFLDEGGGITEIYTTNSNSLMRAWFNDIILIVDDIVTPMDLALSGYTFPQRWSKFLREYTDEQEFPAFLKRASKASPWTESGYSVPWNGKHTHGPCITGISVRTADGEKKPMISLHSRASMVAPVGVLDLGLASSVARAIIQLNPKQPPTFGLTWHISLCQAISWKLLLSCALLGIMDYEGNGLPDTSMGRMIKSHAYDAVYAPERLPTLKMLKRQAMKFGTLVTEGHVGRTSAETFFAEIDPFNYSFKAVRTDKDGLKALPAWDPKDLMNLEDWNDTDDMDSDDD